MHLFDSILDALDTADWGEIVSTSADWVTLGAFVLTLIGLFSAFVTRARLTERVVATPPHQSFTWTLSNTGASPVQQIAYHRTWVTRTGRGVAGDGTLPLVQALYPGEDFRMEVFDSDEVFWSGDERPNEMRMASSSSSDGAVIVLTWRSALIPWRRKRRVGLFMFGRPAIILRGRRARKVARSMAGTDSADPVVALTAELTRANGGVPPTEQSLRDRYPREISEIEPHMLAQGDYPLRVQLLLGGEVLADGRLEEYMIPDPAVLIDSQNGAANKSLAQEPGYLKIDGQSFELRDGHRLRLFAR